MALLLAFLLLLMSYGAGSTTVNHGNITDMLSLLDFKAAVSDPTDALKSWHRSNHVHYCNWTGVSCSSMSPGRVDGLELTGEGLSSEITPSLGNLTFLQTLNLSSNGFSGQLSLPDLNQLRELVYLDLSSNSFQGTIPDSITNCSNLQTVDLSRNMLQGLIPTKIGLLYNLIAMDLGRNNLTGIIPPSISNATQLQLLNLQENQLEGSIPGELGRLSDMVILAIGGNRLSGPIPQVIFNLTSLAVFDGYFNMLEMALPLDMGDTLPNLESLTLGSSMLHGHIPASLGNATKLQVIDLSNSSFVGEIPSFGKLLNLLVLNLEYNKLESGDSQSWESLYGLTNCSQLSMLFLDNNQLRGPIPDSVGKLSTQLQSLEVNGNNLSGIVPLSIGNLSRIIDLDLSENC